MGAFSSGLRGGLRALFVSIPAEMRSRPSRPALRRGFPTRALFSLLTAPVFAASVSARFPARPFSRALIGPVFSALCTIVAGPRFSAPILAMHHGLINRILSRTPGRSVSARFPARPFSRALAMPVFSGAPRPSRASRLRAHLAPSPALDGALSGTASRRFGRSLDFQRGPSPALSLGRSSSRSPMPRRARSPRLYFCRHGLIERCPVRNRLRRFVQATGHHYREQAQPSRLRLPRLKSAAPHRAFLRRRSGLSTASCFQARNSSASSVPAEVPLFARGSRLTPNCRAAGAAPADPSERWSSLPRSDPARYRPA